MMMVMNELLLWYNPFRVKTWRLEGRKSKIGGGKNFKQYALRERHQLDMRVCNGNQKPIRSTGG